MLRTHPLHKRTPTIPNGIFATSMLACLVALALPSPASAAMPRSSRPRVHAHLTPTNGLPALHLKSHSVKIKVHGRVARVITEAVYHNSTSRGLEATFTFPIPEGAAVDRFVLWMEGKPVEAKISEKKRARRTYQRIVNRRVDPGLLEQVSREIFRYRIFPVPAHGDQRVRLEYSQVLPLSKSGKEIVLNYPLTASQDKGDTNRIAKNFLAQVEFDMESPISKISSSSHNISSHVDEENPNKGIATVEESYRHLDRDFQIKIQLTKKATEVAVLPYRLKSKNEDGTLMLFLTPRIAEGEQLPGKDIVFVMDTSGSMTGPKIDQARNALGSCLHKLRKEDRFAIVAFSGHVKTFSKKFEAATKENIAKARIFTGNLIAAGGTNIELALKRALRYKNTNGRISQILFATDGVPSLGESDPTKLVALLPNQNESTAAKNGTSPIRIFTFGVGFDVNTKLLDGLAEKTQALRRYVRPDERIETKIAALWNRIKTPALTNVSITFSDNLNVEQMYPQKPKDLYLNQQTTIVARYRGTASGTGTVIIKGQRGKKTVILESPITLPADTGTATAFVSRQWALRKTGYLLDQLRLKGNNPELKNEIIRLGTKFGIVTPFTSYLALEAADRTQFDRETRNLKKRKRTAANRRVRPANNPIVLHEEVEVADHNETDNAMSDVPLGGMGTVASIGLGGGGGGAFGHRATGARRRLAMQGGAVGIANELALKNALIWLAAQQNSDGSWQETAPSASRPVTLTSHALLSLLGAGHTEKIGKYKTNVRLAIHWLSKKINSAGRIGEHGLIPFESHLLAGHALAEAAAMGRVPDTIRAAQQALDYSSGIILKNTTSKNKTLDQAALLKGGPTTLSLMIMQFKIARIAGLSGDPGIWDECLELLERFKIILPINKKGIQIEAYADGPGSSKPSWQATISACRIKSAMGLDRSELLKPMQWAVEQSGLPKWKSLSNEMNFHHLQKATDVFRYINGQHWNTWNTNISKILLAHQSKIYAAKGSWNLPPSSDTKKQKGQIWRTTQAALCLETPYRSFSYQRPSQFKSTNNRATTTTPRTGKTSVPSSHTGKAAVDYSEWIRKLQEGEE